MTDRLSDTDERRLPLDRDGVHHTARWMKRAGLAARGTVYLLIGLLALRVAFGRGQGGEEASPSGALDAISRQPFGTALLLVLAAGLLAYGAYEVASAFVLPDGGRRWTRKVGLTVSGVFYAGLAVLAGATAVGGPGANGGEDPSGFTARVMQVPGGRWLIGAVGVVFLAAAVYMAKRGLTEPFLDRLEREAMPRWLLGAADRIGTWGLVARGVALALVGWFLLLSAVQFDPEEARGLDGALRELARQPYGPWLLATVALGFLAYAFLSFVEARYRRVAGDG